MVFQIISTLVVVDTDFVFYCCTYVPVRSTDKNPPSAFFIQRVQKMLPIIILPLSITIIRTGTYPVHCTGTRIVY